MKYDISYGLSDFKIEIETNSEVPLKPYERLVCGIDTGSGEYDAIVYTVYDFLTGKLRIIDVETSDPSQTG